MKIIQLPAKNEILDNDLLVVDSGNITYRITAGQLYYYINEKVLIFISSAQVVLDPVLAGKNYICQASAVSSLAINSFEKSLKETTITFFSGTTPTELILPSGTNTSNLPDIEANTKYEISIFNGDMVMGIVTELTGAV